METATLVAQLSQFIAGMDEGDWIALFALVFSIASLWISWRRSKAAEDRAEKTEDIVRLLGEKETVAFAAIKLQDVGLPDKDKDPEHFRLVLRAIMTACVFTNSDRARALLYDVLYHAPPSTAGISKRRGTP